jgi:hypothetical protein
MHSQTEHLYLERNILVVVQGFVVVCKWFSATRRRCFSQILASHTFIKKVALVMVSSRYV